MKPVILNANGTPMSPDIKSLPEHQSRATKRGVRSVKTKAVMSSLTPARAAKMIKAANEGDMFDYLTAAEEMEESSPHYASVLGTRKRAVVGLDVVLEAASDDAKDQEIFEVVKEIVEAAPFSDLVANALDALAKGFSINEIIYRKDANAWLPVAYEWVDPRFFIFDETTRQTPLLLQDDAEPIELEYSKYIFHTPNLKSGIPVRGGLARLVMWSIMCASFSARDWMAFTEVFGMPVRLGKYPNGTKPEDVDILANAVAQIASDSAAVIPETMQIEFVAAANSAKGDAIFEKAAKYFEALISKAVLGQTMTTDDGSSQSQANVHNDVRLDILEGDAKNLAATIQRDLIDVFVALNYGAQYKSPRISFPVPKPEDIAVLTAALKELVPLGLKVSMSEVRGRVGFSKPADDEEILSLIINATGGEELDPIPEKNKVELNRANNADGATDADDLLDDLEAELFEDYVSLSGLMADEILSKFDAANSYEEFKAILDDFDLSKINGDDLRNVMAESCTIARAIGDKHD